MDESVRDLIGLLEDMIANAKGLPLGVEKCLVEREKALSLIDEIKNKLPAELDEARRLVQARAEYVSNAKREAEDMRRNAEERARRLMDEQEIVRYAKAKSAEIMSSAEKNSNDLRRAANQYADDVMRRAEESVAETLAQLRQSRSRFRSLAGSELQSAPTADSGDVMVDLN